MEPVSSTRGSIREILFPKSLPARVLIVAIALAVLIAWDYMSRKPSGKRLSALPSPDASSNTVTQLTSAYPNFQSPLAISEALEAFKHPRKKVSLTGIFPLNGHYYQCCGLKNYIEDNKSKKVATLIAEFMNELQQARLIVNLQLKDSEYSEETSKTLDKFKENPRKLHSIVDWEEGSCKHSEGIQEVLKSAKSIATLVKTCDDTLFVLAGTGMKNTAVFIAILELFRSPSILEQNNEMVHRFIFDILNRLRILIPGCQPSSEQIAQLFSDDFITTIRKA